jgi:hypothetical protein
MRDALHAEARRQDRSASAVIRLAIRAWLDGQAAPSVTAQQQHSEREPVAPRAVRASRRAQEAATEQA